MDWNLLVKVPNRGLILSKGRHLNFVDFDGGNIWRSSLICKDKPDSASVSGDRLVITTTTEDYHAWGFLGPAILIDLNNGEIIKELKGEKIQALSNGEFLLGLEGYEFFHTWLYDGEGSKQEWKSYGEYFQTQDGIIVIEKNRQNPDSSYLKKLNRDGSIVQRMKLKSSRSSNALLLNADNFIFENGGELIISDSKLKEIKTQKLIKYSEEEATRFSSRITRNDQKILVEILERTSEPIENYRTHIWKFQV